MSDPYRRCVELVKTCFFFPLLTSLMLGKEMSFWFIIAVKALGMGKEGVAGTEHHLVWAR